MQRSPTEWFLHRFLAHANSARSLVFVSEPDYTLGLWGEFKKSAAYTWRLFRHVLKVCFVLGVILLVLSTVFAPPLAPGNGRHNTWLQTGRRIGQLMFAYSTDHNDDYPDGNSSIEVFQKLLDGGYCTDPNIFFIPLPGKTKPVAGQKLKPENVCWDVTSGVDAHSPDGLPLVFMTGYKVTYTPGTSAVPIIKPYPQFGPEPLTWIIGGMDDDPSSDQRHRPE